MKVLVDTNVLLDVLARRDPFYVAASALWSMAERNRTDAWISAISYNNVYCILRKHGGRDAAHEAVRALRDVFDTVVLDLRIVNQAADSSTMDFEDAIQFYCAARIGADYLVTRNPSDFPSDGSVIVTPAEYLAVSSVDSDLGSDG